MVRTFILQNYTISGMLLEHIIEQIFCQLDYESLASAEMVSTVWRETVQSSGEIWRNLFERNVKIYFSHLVEFLFCSIFFAGTWYLLNLDVHDNCLILMAFYYYYFFFCHIFVTT
jgi:hypothetical protein